MLLLPENVIEVGVDEAGRGVLYGSVVAAAVILPHTYHPEYENIKDSKKLSEKKREKVATFIKEHAIAYSICEATAQEIDEINILNATYLAMHRALENITCDYDLIRVDGNRFKSFKDKKHECVVGGDGKYLSIAAASILAKVHRDHLILENVATNPELEKYDLKKNKGYGTPKHIEALKIYGAVEGHRMTFRPIAS